MDDNICSTRILLGNSPLGNSPLRIIAAHDPQESELIENRQSFYRELNIEVKTATMQGDTPIIMGDLNAKIENEEDEITAMSPNGELLSDLMKENDLVAINHLPSCIGKWTRQNKKNPEEKSTID